MLPLPEAGRPMVVLSLVQLKTEVFAPEKLTAMAWPAQLVPFAGKLATGVALTVIENV